MSEAPTKQQQVRCTAASPRNYDAAGRKMTRFAHAHTGNAANAGRHAGAAAAAAAAIPSITAFADEGGCRDQQLHCALRASVVVACGCGCECRAAHVGIM